MTELPIVYVRGFGGPQSGINDAADDPFYGFNAGATHIRVGGDKQPQFYQFEGPLVRLMQDVDYSVLVHGNQSLFLQLSQSGSLTPKSVWIYRFYDQSADTFGVHGQKYDLPTAADELLPFIDLILDRTGAQKVWLVAHSMGGLICRSMIQRTCPEAGRSAKDVVDKLYTYATPHNGIEFQVASIHVSVPQIAPVGAEIFNRDVMYRYLTPSQERQPHRPDDWDAHVVPATAFDSQRIFCLIGTDAADYGLVSKLVGPRSDGLVQIDNAYVRSAPRAYVHRSHSGRYGEVNSEEGYQNLRRFLLGSRKVTVSLVDAALPPNPTHNDDVWQMEARVSIRGLPVLITDQVAEHYNAIALGTVASRTAAPTPINDSPIATVFLLDPSGQQQLARDNFTPDVPPSPRVRYSLIVRILHLQQHDGFLSFGSHLETLAEWADALIVDVGPADGRPDTEFLWSAWASDVAQVTAELDPIAPDTTSPTEGTLATGLVFDIPLPRASSQAAVVLGDRAAIRLRIEPWA